MTRDRSSRRAFLRASTQGLVGLALASSAPALWLAGCHRDAQGTRPAFGPLGAADPNGQRLPPGFRSRVLVRSGEIVAGTSHVWHANPDGRRLYFSSQRFPGTTFEVEGPFV